MAISLRRLGRIEAILAPRDKAPDFRLILPINGRDPAEVGMDPRTYKVITSSGTRYLGPADGAEYDELFEEAPS